VQSAARADVFVSSGPSSDGTIVLQSGRGQDAVVRLEDTRADSNSGTFVIKSSGDKRLRVEDANSALMMAVTDTGTTGDLTVTGDVEFGSSVSTSATAVTIQGGKQVMMDVVAGTGSAAQMSLSGQTAMVKLGSRNATNFAIYTGGSASAKSLRIGVPRSPEEYGSTPSMDSIDAYQDIVSIVDRGKTGDLHVSGDVVIGGNATSLAGPKSLTVTSSLSASLLVQSGHFDNSTLHLKCGPGHHSKIVLSQADIVEVGKEAEGASFVIETGTDAVTANPLLDFTDGPANGNTANRMMAIVDSGKLGDLYVTGNGVFGDAAATSVMNNEISVRGAEASINVTAGPAAPATVMIKSGKDQNAELRLASHTTSSYAFVNVGAGDTKRLDLLHTENRSSAQVTQSIMQISDLGSTGQLAFDGDVIIGSSNQSAPATLDVTSGMGQGKAVIELQSGDKYGSTLTLTSGANQVSTISLISKEAVNSASSADARFDIVLDGAVHPPALQFKQGSTKMMSIINTGALHSARLEQVIFHVCICMGFWGLEIPT
jgi:hypothetical protein